MEAGRATELTKAGNDHADHFAGRGVQVSEHLAPSLADKEAYREARRWYDWLMVLCCHWPSDTQPKAGVQQDDEGSKVPDGVQEGELREIVPSTSRRARQLGHLVNEEFPHELYENNGQLKCKACPGFASLGATTSSIKGFARSACKGSPLEQPGDGHDLWQTGPYLWCTRCGSFTSGQRMARGIKAVCIGRRGLGLKGTAVVRRLQAGCSPYKGVRISEARRKPQARGSMIGPAAANNNQITSPAAHRHSTDAGVDFVRLPCDAGVDFVRLPCDAGVDFVRLPCDAGVDFVRLPCDAGVEISAVALHGQASPGSVDPEAAQGRHEEQAESSVTSDDLQAAADPATVQEDQAIQDLLELQRAGFAVAWSHRRAPAVTGIARDQPTAAAGPQADVGPTAPSRPSVAIEPSAVVEPSVEEAQAMQDLLELGLPTRQTGRRRR